tara:strand:- start:675 stop:1055 length:381 start_codon:yes stop_codon:yes gene_type:complete
MGKKSKSAGTTKHRTRTCDRPECISAIEKRFLSYGKKYPKKSGKVVKTARNQYCKKMNDRDWNDDNKNKEYMNMVDLYNMVELLNKQDGEQHRVVVCSKKDLPEDAESSTLLNLVMGKIDDQVVNL